MRSEVDNTKPKKKNLSKMRLFACALLVIATTRVNLVWTTTFPSNVHKMMTPEEISQTFGTDDGSVPDYQVLSMVLPGARRRRQTDDEIHFKVEIDNTEINLIFKPTAGYLATKYTPVWSAVTDQKAYNKIRYNPLPNAMKDIGEFKMYQDVVNEAAIVVYADPEYGAIVEGIVTSHYAIKSLPSRLMNQTLKVGHNNFVKTYGKRSIERNADEVTGCVLFKSLRSTQDAERYVYEQVEEHHRHSRERRQSSPEVFYPEILLVLDHNAIRNHTITQALRFMLALWNAVDMVYSNLKNPIIHLNIAGIIISADDAATPYIADNTSIKIKAYGEFVLGNLSEYFAKELDRFPLGQYDMIFAMTPIRLCNEEANPCSKLLGITYLRSACTTENIAKLTGRIWSAGVIYYNWMFDGVVTAAHESAHLFGVDHDTGEGATANCTESEGYAMAKSSDLSRRNLKWSPCSESLLQDYFSSTQSRCLDNPPMWTKPFEKVLPGRWLTLDGQCQNDGFEKWCQFPEFPVCMIKGCRAKNSSVCEASRYIPLSGSKCGENKYCIFEIGCVDE